jgi:hypothetical protein
VSLPLVVVILVATGDAREVSTQTLTTTTQEALDPGAIVLLREVSVPQLSDAEAVRIGGALHADAVALVTWPSEDHARARVHLYAVKGTSWVDRDIAFASSDAPLERGRTIGFTVAAMVPPQAPEPVVARPPEPPPANAAPRAAPVSTATRPTVASIDFVASGTVGIGGPGVAIGGDFAARWHVARSLWARAGGTLRVGEVRAAQASSSVIRVAAGVAWDPFEASAASRLSTALRGDLLLLRQSLSRPVDEGSSVDGARWVPGVDVLVEGAWSLVPRISLLAAIGPEVAFGPTRVIVNGEAVATIPSVRIVGELGIRASF